MHNPTGQISISMDKVFKYQVRHLLFVLLLLLSLSVSASTTLSAVYDSSINQITVTLQCTSYCDYFRRTSGGSWSLISKPRYDDGELTYTYSGPSPGEHEFKLEKGGYTNTGWGVVEVHQDSVMVPIGGEQITSYQYDVHGRLREVVRPSGAASTYDYDDADNRTSKTVTP